VFAVLCGVSSAYIGGDYKLYVPGIPFHIFETITIFTVPIVVLAILANITAFKRLYDAKKVMDAAEQDRKND
jgi:CDP-diacylglycerol--glycerol-3-phosphate 3-phosphatidyltransferase